MWHEARKQEKKLRGLMVDFKRRAERRREFYERIKKDPHSFLRMYGQPVKIHLDPAIAAAAESPQSMMPWQGDRENMIDRFDVRANLDIIPSYDSSALPEAEEVEDDLRCNYERYRCIVQNDCAGISEEQVLRQIYVDEMFGDVTKNKEIEEEKKKASDKKAAIAFKYEDSTPAKPEVSAKATASESESDETDVEDVDLDVAFDIDEITDEQKQLLNITALNYGIAMGEYTEQLRKDKEEEQVLKEARAMEEEKAAFSGRKSRRERRIFKEQKIRDRQMSPPSYAARESPKYNPYQKSSDSSRSPSPAHARPTFITSFGDADAGELPERQRPSNQAAASRKVERGGGSARSNSSRWRRRSRSDSRSPVRKQQRPSQPTVLASSVNRRHNHYSPSGHGSGRRRSSPSRSKSKSSSRSPSTGRRRLSHSRTARSGSRSETVQKQSLSGPHRSKSPTPRVFKRYRRPSLESKSSEDEASSEDDTPVRGSVREGSQRAAPGNALSKSATSSQASTGMSIKEKLKRRMQAALNKHYKADKRLELEKKEKARQEKLDREDEMRARLDDYRRKEREKRHHDDSSSGRRRSVTRSPSQSRSRSRSWSPHSRRARTPPKSRSRSPPLRDRRYRYN